MIWNNLIIENSHGVVTPENIDEFNLAFWSKVNNEHDMDTPDGQYCEFVITLWGLRLRGWYTAMWVGDTGYPNETEPSDIELSYIDELEVAQKRN